MSRRRCCFCHFLKGDSEIKKGQIAHVDGNRNNNKLGNLAWLCLEHHDEYDGVTSQSKNLFLEELKAYRGGLYVYVIDNLPRVREISDVSELIDEVNSRRVSADGSNRFPLEEVAAEFAIPSDELRLLLLEYARERQVAEGGALEASKALLAAGEYREARDAAAALLGQLDHLKVEAEKQLEELRKNKISALNLLAVASFHLGKPSEAGEHLATALELLQDGDEYKVVSEIKRLMAFVKVVTGCGGEAMELCESVLKAKLACESKIPLTFEERFSFAEIMRAAGDLPSAEKQFQICKKLLEDGGLVETGGYAACLCSLAALSMDQRSYETAEALIFQAMGLKCVRDVLGPLLISCRFLQGKVKRLKGDLEGGRDSLRACLLEAEQFYGGPVGFVGMVHNEIGLTFLGQNGFTEAENAFLEARKIAETAPIDLGLLSASLANLGRVYRRSGNVDASLRALTDALKARESFLGLEHPWVQELRDAIGRVSEGYPI